MRKEFKSEARKKRKLDIDSYFTIIGGENKLFISKNEFEPHMNKECKICGIQRAESTQDDVQMEENIVQTDKPSSSSLTPASVLQQSTSQLVPGSDSGIPTIPDDVDMDIFESLPGPSSKRSADQEPTSRYQDSGTPGGESQSFEILPGIRSLQRIDSGGERLRKNLENISIIEEYEQDEEDDVQDQHRPDLILTQEVNEPHNYTPSPITKIVNPHDSITVTPTQAVSQEESSKRILKDQYAAFLRNKKKSKFHFKIKQNNDDAPQDDFIFAGNKAIEISAFTGAAIANLYKCLICKHVSYVKPLLLSCCNSIICPECFTQWGLKSRHCFGKFYDYCGEFQNAEPITGFREQAWENLEPRCPKCECNIKIQDYSFHLFCCTKKKRGRVRKERNFVDILHAKGPHSSKILKEKMKPIRDSIVDFKTTDDDAPDEAVIGLMASLSFLKESRNITAVYALEELVHKIINNNFENSAKLTPLQSAIIRKIANFSVGQMQIQSKLLKKFSKKENLNIFASYKQYKICEDNQLPSNLSYVMIKPCGTEMNIDGSEAEMRSFMEDYDHYITIIELPKPAMIGIYVVPHCVVVKEVSAMLPDLKEGSPMEIRNIKVWVIFGSGKF